MSEFSWPCFWLVYILGKADILPKVSQIISSLWLVYGFVTSFLLHVIQEWSLPKQNFTGEMEIRYFTVNFCVWQLCYISGQ